MRLVTSILLGVSSLGQRATWGVLLARQNDVRTSYASCGQFESVMGDIAAGAFPTDGWVSAAGLNSLPYVLGQLRTGHLLKVLSEDRWQNRSRRGAQAKSPIWLTVSSYRLTTCPVYPTWRCSCDGSIVSSLRIESDNWRAVTECSWTNGTWMHWSNYS